MKKMFLVVRQEYLNRVRTKGFLIGTLIIPIIMGVLILFPLLLDRVDDEGTRTFAVVDSSGVIFAQLAESFPDTTQAGDPRYRFEDYLRGHRTEVDWAPRLSAETMNGTIDGFFMIPPSFPKGGTEARFYAQNVSDMSRNLRFRRALEGLARRARIKDSGLSEEQIGQILAPTAFTTFRVDGGEATEDTGQTFGLAYVFSFVFYISLFTYGLTTLRTTLEEKTARTAELMVSHVRPLHLMGGKILGVGAVGLTQLGIWFLAAALLTTQSAALPGPMASAVEQIRATAPSPAVITVFFVFFFFGFLFYSGMFVSIGAMVNSETEAQQMQTPVVMPIILAFIISMVLGTRSPDGTIVVVLSMIPFFSPILMVVRACVLMPPLWQILLSLGILILGTWASIWISARIFRVGLLMYGKKPNLPEMLRWIRQA